MAQPSPLDRELVDYMNGEDPWSKRVELELRQLKRVYGHAADAINRNTGATQKLAERLTISDRLAGTRHAEILGRLTVRRSAPEYPPWTEEDANAITGVEDPAELAHSARVMRARAAAEELQRKEAEAAFARWKKRGLLAGAFLLGAGGALVKMVELLVQLLAK